MKDTRLLDFDDNGVAIPDDAFWFAWKNRDRQSLYQVYGLVRPIKLEPSQQRATGYPQWIVFADTQFYFAFFKDLDNLPRRQHFFMSML